MLRRIDTLINEKEIFAFETTLSTLLYKNRIKIAKEKGYQIVLVFFWLRDVNLAIERVKLRVKEGGHNIPVDIIERRYKNGIKNLFSIYLPIVDEAYFFDNSDNTPELIAEKNESSIFDIKNSEKFNQLKFYAT